MSKKNNQRCGTLFSPELQEITRRLKDKDPLLDEIVQRGSEQTPGLVHRAAGNNVDDLRTDHAEPNEEPPEGD